MRATNSRGTRKGRKKVVSPEHPVAVQRDVPALKSWSNSTGSLIACASCVNQTLWWCDYELPMCAIFGYAILN